MNEPLSINFAVYDTDGRIRGIYSMPAQYMQQQVGPDQKAVICAPNLSDIDHYVDTTYDIVREQQPHTASWDTQTLTGAEVATLSGLPIPCTVYIDDVPIEVTDGVFEFSAGSPGDYRIRVNEVMYLSQEWIIDAN